MKITVLAAAFSLAAAAGAGVPLEIGWGEVDITPPTTKRIPLCGQYYQRLPDVWGPNEYSDFALERVAGAYVEAWKGRKPGGVQRAFGQARVGHCRLALYADGSTSARSATKAPTGSAISPQIASTGCSAR